MFVAKYGYIQKRINRIVDDKYSCDNRLAHFINITAINIINNRTSKNDTQD